MKKQVVLIHGGDAFDTYQEYLADLRRETFDLQESKPGRWRDSLQEKLGQGYQVVAPRMPNSDNAKYLEWKIWFDKIARQLKGDVTLVGHSLGGIFLARYLAENRFPGRLKAVLLIAPPWNIKGSDKSIADFIMPKNIHRLKELGAKVNLYHSKDDPIVDFMNVKKYAKALPNAVLHIYKDKGHFIGPTFPELVKDIKALYK